jgi:hypothetical protein
VSELTADRIAAHATRLGLTHLADTIADLVARAETAKMGYLDFVDLLLEEELGLREGRRFRNALKLSGLPHHKTLDGPTSPSNPTSTPARSATWPPSGSSAPRATSRCSARPASARR